MSSDSRIQEVPLSMRWKWPFYVLSVYPIADYFLHISPWGIIGQSWAKFILIYLLFLAIKSRRLGRLLGQYSTYKVMAAFIMLGLAYVVMDIGKFKIAISGYEIDFMYMLIALLLPFALTKEDVIPLLKWMAFTGFLLAMHGWYEYIIRAPIPVWWNDIGQTVRTRVYSVFWSSNTFGDYMGFIVPLALGLALYEKDRAQRWFYGLTAATSGVTLIFTGDRGAWLACFASLVVLTWLVDKRYALGVLAIAALSYFFIPSVHLRMQEFLSPIYWSKTFANGRIDEWANAFNKMLANPLFGSGLGTYGGAVAANYLGIKYVDGFYAFMLGETGLVGLGAYMLLIFVYLRDVIRVWKKTTDVHLKRLLAGVFSALLVFILHASVENIYQVPAIVMTFWMTGVLALIFGADQYKASE